MVIGTMMIQRVQFGTSAFGIITEKINAIKSIQIELYDKEKEKYLIEPDIREFITSAGGINKRRVS